MAQPTSTDDDSADAPASPPDLFLGLQRARWSRLGAYLWSAKAYFLVGAVFLVLTNLLALRIPRMIGGTIQHLRDSDAAGVAADASLIDANVLALVLLAVGAAGARILSRIFVFNGGRLVEYDVRNAVFAHLTRLDQRYFQGQATGDLVSRTINDVTQVRLLYGVGILNVVNTAVAYVIVLTMMFQLNVTLTLWALAPYPIILLTVRLFTKALYTRTQDVQAQLSVVSAQAQENLSGAAVVKAFAIEDQQRARFAKASQDYVDRNMALARVRGALMPYMAAIGGVGTLVILGVGGSYVVDKTITLGQYVEFSAYIARLAWPTMALGWIASLWQRGMAGFDRLCDILDAPPKIAEPSPSQAQPLPPRTDGGAARGEVVLEGVTLEYEDGTKALDDVSMTIPAGSTVALVGKTGAGKSTLVELIPRLRDPTSGRVLIDGCEADKIPLNQLRSAVGFAPQTPFLFSTTLEENIRLGLLARDAMAAEREADPDADPNAWTPPPTRLTLDDAIRIAHFADDLPAFPDGLDTMVGERGITLSGGQKQRVTIARAVLLDPTILILDDSLASVDTRTERAILDELGRLMRGRTSILVTHRFNALALVDQIFVMDEGRIVERGTHDDLIAKGGVYAEMVERQRLEASLGGGDDDPPDPTPALGDLEANASNPTPNSEG